MTILGLHSAAETRDLLNTLDARFDAVNEAFKALASPAEDLRTDWPKEYHRWKNDAGVVGMKLHAYLFAAPPLVSADTLPTEGLYQEVIAFFERGKEPGKLRDCQERIERARGSQVDVKRVPMDAPDVDLAVLKKIDRAVDASKQAASAVGDTAFASLTSPTGLLTLGVLTVGIAGGIALAVGPTVSAFAPRRRR